MVMGRLGGFGSFGAWWRSEDPSEGPGEASMEGSPSTEASPPAPTAHEEPFESGFGPGFEPGPERGAGLDGVQLLSPSARLAGWSPGHELLTRYTSGMGWMLAHRLHVRTGWPLAAILVDGGQADMRWLWPWFGEPVFAWVHCGVVVDGRFLDVAGLYSVGETIRRWEVFSSDDRWVGVEAVDCVDATMAFGYSSAFDGEPADWCAADAVARAMLDRMQVPLVHRPVPCATCLDVLLHAGRHDTQWAGRSFGGAEKDDGGREADGWIRY